MSSGNIVDLVILGLGILAIITGWRRGGMSCVLAIIGVIGGGAAGLWLLPQIIPLIENRALRYFTTIGIEAASIIIGYGIGSRLGWGMRQQIRHRSVARVDSAVGSVVQTFTLLIVAWLVAIPLVNTNSGAVAKGLRESQVLTEFHRTAPDWVNLVPAQLGALLRQGQMPSVVDPFDSMPIRNVDPPVSDVLAPQVISQLQPSVVRVVSIATQCKRQLQGTGFVVAPDTVVTNAHVVAGADQVRLQTVNGENEATVVLYNPSEDIAVLRATDLGLAPLPWAPAPAPSGSNAAVVGYPLGGPFDVQSARIRDRMIVQGPDIYASQRVDRDAYTIRGLVRRGNSGGPMVNPEGQVLGVVFGAAADDPDTGYVLTDREVEKTVGPLDRIGDYRETVDTQQCVAE